MIWITIRLVNCAWSWKVILHVSVCSTAISEDSLEDVSWIMFWIMLRSSIFKYPKKIVSGRADFWVLFRFELILRENVRQTFWVFSNLQTAFSENSRRRLCGEFSFLTNYSTQPSEFTRKHLWQSLLWDKLQLPISGFKKNVCGGVHFF